MGMFFLGILWAWVLANLVNEITNMDAFSTESHQLMDDLNLLMEHRALDTKLRHRLRKHLYESFTVHRQRHQQRTVRWLSAGLQGEIAVASGVDKACDCVWYLRNLPETVLIDVAQRFVGEMFSPNEFVRDRYSVMVIRKGTLIRRGKILTRDSVIGEDMILTTEVLLDTGSPRTLTFVEAMTLSRNDLVAVCEAHPDFDRRMRRAQIKLALWRAFVQAANNQLRGKSALALLRDETADGRNLRPRRGFAETARTHRGAKGMSVQESLQESIEELDALKMRVEATQGNFMRNLDTLHARMDRLERLDSIRLHKPSIRFCGRSPD